MVGGMGIVAAGAIAVFYGRMNMAFFEVLGEIGMTVETELAAGSGFEFEILFH